MLGRAFDERVPRLFLRDLGLVRARRRVVVLHDRRGAPHERDPDAWSRAWPGARDRATTRGAPEGLLGSSRRPAPRSHAVWVDERCRSGAAWLDDRSRAAP